MKRIVLSLVGLSICSAIALAEVNGGDSRAKSMGGAMTAVNDDMNTLFYNPAGLAFLRKNYISASSDLEYTLQRGYEYSDLPELYEWQSGSSDLEGNWTYSSGYGYIDSEGNEVNDVDFTDYANILTGSYAPTDDDGDGSISDDEWYTAYLKYREAELEYNSVKYADITLTPRFIIGGPHWGAAALGDFYLVPDMNSFQGDDTDDTMSYDVYRTLTAVVGTGIKVGGIALGGNLRYSASSYYTVDDVTYSDGLGDNFLSQLLSPSSSSIIASATELDAGVGALVTLGSINLGFYNANIIPFIDEDKMDDGFFSALMDTTNFGISWMPSDNKFGKKDFLSLIVSADINNLGDTENRQLAAGAELGLNFSDFLVATGRIGYSQPIGIGKELFDIRTGDIDINDSLLSAGLTARLWLAKIDLGVSVPWSTINYIATYDGSALPADENYDELVSVNLTVSLNL